MTENTTTPAPTDDLQKRCAEIIGWHRTGVLVGDALRSHAESKWPGEVRSLQMAERATENEAIGLIAKWGVPAPVAEGFDEWLEKQFEFRNYYFDPRGPGLMAIPFARRAYEAGRAQAAAAHMQRLFLGQEQEPTQ